MKKIITAVVAFTLLIAISSQAIATDGSSETQRVYIANVIDTSATPILPRAKVPPTEYAPVSWYNTDHTWTATNYTYSSYFFNTTLYPYLDIAANVPFRVDLYHTNGTYWGSTTPPYDSAKGKYFEAYFFYPNEDYYMVIYNLSGSPISSGAWYRVGNVF
jgi:hypothetical protein